MNYFIYLLLITLLSFDAIASSKDLTILVHENSISNKVIDDFKKNTNISVKIKTYKNISERDYLLVESNGNGFDIVMLDHASVEKYKRAGWINELTIQDYGLYNTLAWNYGSFVMLVHESVADDISTWTDFYSYCFKSDAKISVIDNPHVTINTSLIAMDFEINTGNKLYLNEIQRNYFNTCHFELNSLNSLNSFNKPLDIDYAAIMMKDDEAVYIARNSDKYAVNTPKETINWVNYLAITRSSNNHKDAKKLLDFLSLDESKIKNSKEEDTKMILNNALKNKEHNLNLSHFRDSLLSKRYTDIHYLIYVN